jgi:hypothetical protein
MRHIGARLVWIALLSIICSGCSAPRGPLVVEDPDLDVKIPAIKKAVRTGDYSQDAQLVQDLQSDDPAVRFYAINGLHRITGENFGYRYYDSEDARQPAIEKWKAWLARHAATSRSNTMRATTRPNP